MQKAIGVIYDEHRSLSMVLSGMNSFAQMTCDCELRPDFAVFRAMIYYVDAFPECMHHPKEDMHLFARLVERDPDARDLVEALKAEHVKGARLVRGLEHALRGFEETWPWGAEKFAAAVESYAQFYWNHMRREERELIPRAERSLSAEDWRDVEAAFAGNSDPIAGLHETDFRALYQRILHLAPAPVGLGDHWEKTA